MPVSRTNRGSRRIPKSPGIRSFYNERTLDDFYVPDRPYNSVKTEDVSANTDDSETSGEELTELAPADRNHIEGAYDNHATGTKENKIKSDKDSNTSKLLAETKIPNGPNVASFYNEGTLDEFKLPKGLSVLSNRQSTITTPINEEETSENVSDQGSTLQHNASHSQNNGKGFYDDADSSRKESPVMCDSSISSITHSKFRPNDGGRKASKERTEEKTQYTLDESHDVAFVKYKSSKRTKLPRSPTEVVEETSTSPTVITQQNQDILGLHANRTNRHLSSQSAETKQTSNAVKSRNDNDRKSLKQTADTEQRLNVSRYAGEKAGSRSTRTVYTDHQLDAFESPVEKSDRRLESLTVDRAYKLDPFRPPTERTDGRVKSQTDGSEYKLIAHRSPRYRAERRAKSQTFETEQKLNSLRTPRGRPDNRTTIKFYEDSNVLRGDLKNRSIIQTFNAQSPRSQKVKSPRNPQNEAFRRNVHTLPSSRSFMYDCYVPNSRNNSLNGVRLPRLLKGEMFKQDRDLDDIRSQLNQKLAASRRNMQAKMFRDNPFHFLTAQSSGVFGGHPPSYMQELVDQLAVPIDRRMQHDSSLNTSSSENRSISGRYSPSQDGDSIYQLTQRVSKPTYCTSVRYTSATEPLRLPKIKKCKRCSSTPSNRFADEFSVDKLLLAGDK